MENNFERELVIANYLNKPDVELMRKYNSTYKNIPDMTIKNMLEESLKKYAENTAVSEGKRSISYKELDKSSSEFAEKLSLMGAERGDVIGVKAIKQIDTIIAVIGIIRGGFVYLPVHAEYPEEKKKYIFESCNCHFFTEGLSVYPLSSFIKEKKNNYIFQNSEKSMAYIIYTSGSTGMPKGVAVSNCSVCNTILDINERFNVNDKDKIIGLSALTFDLSVYDIFGSLQCGAELLLINNQRDIKSILNAIRKENITLWNSVPAIMEMVMLAVDDNECFETVRNILLSGDSIPVTLPEKLRKHFPNAKIYSLGGATEGSIWSIYYPITDFSSDALRVPYGYPLANQTMTVRDIDMKLCPVGVEGEICIGGKGVAMGYMNDYEKTSSSFVNTSEGIIYCTGDRGVMNEKGYMDFLGRLDNQVKLNGYRIETGEIESAVLQNENIISASAFVYTDENNGNKMLTVCYTSETELDEREIHQDLKKLLVDYMIPHLIIRVDSIPLTLNGKVDKKALCCLIAGMEVAEDDSDFDEYEQKVADIWKKILNVNTVNRKSNFFSSGGDSLKAMRMIESLERNGIVSESVTITDIFSVSDFGTLISRLKEVMYAEQLEKENMEEGEL